LFDKYLDSFKKEKPHVVSEMKEWLTTLQHTYKSPTIECSYFFEIECKHTGLGGKDMPLIVFPVLIYYSSNATTSGAFSPQALNISPMMQ
jgi:hypothetical protein